MTEETKSFINQLIDYRIASVRPWILNHTFQLTLLPIDRVNPDMGEAELTRDLKILKMELMELEKAKNDLNAGLQPVLEKPKSMAEKGFICRQGTEGCDNYKYDNICRCY